MNSLTCLFILSQPAIGPRALAAVRDTQRPTISPHTLWIVWAAYHGWQHWTRGWCSSPMCHCSQSNIRNCWVCSLQIYICTDSRRYALAWLIGQTSPPFFTYLAYQAFKFIVSSLAVGRWLQNDTSADIRVTNCLLMLKYLKFHKYNVGKFITIAGC